MISSVFSFFVLLALNLYSFFFCRKRYFCVFCAGTLLESFYSWLVCLFNIQGSSRSGGESTDSGSAVNTLSSKAGGHLEPESPVSTKLSSDHQQAFDHNHLQFPQENHHHHQQLQVVEMTSDSPRSSSGPTQTQPSSNTILEKVVNFSYNSSLFSRMQEKGGIFCSCSLSFISFQIRSTIITKKTFYESTEEDLFDLFEIF